MQLRRPARATRTRRGMSMVEVLVSIAIMLAVAGLLAYPLMGVLQVQQRKAAKQLVMTYERLHDEAALRNRTFRVIFDLDNSKMKIEVGEARAIIYTSTEQRLKYEEAERRKIALMDDEEKARYLAARKPFEKLQSNFKDEWQLPTSLRFGGVYTPQYGKLMTQEDLPEDPEEGNREIYSYVFANGFTEHTVIWLVDANEEDEGWTVVVEPLSGKVRLLPELVDWEDTIGRIPEEGPDLPS